MEIWTVNPYSITGKIGVAYPSTGQWRTRPSHLVLEPPATVAFGRQLYPLDHCDSRAAVLAPHSFNRRAAYNPSGRSNKHRPCAFAPVATSVWIKHRSTHPDYRCSRQRRPEQVQSVGIHKLFGSRVDRAFKNSQLIRKRPDDSHVSYGTGH